jgi:cytidine deaminase
VNIERVQRPELVFGVVGPVGVDLDMIIEVISTQLKRQNYTFDVIHVTTLMKEIPSNIVLKDDNYFDRIKSRIEYADDICKRLARADALAAITLSAIQSIREVQHRKRGTPQSEIDVEEPLDSHAFIIRQFKRPDEIRLLRQIYGKLFFQISAYGSPSDRESQIYKEIKDSNFGAIDDMTARCQTIELMSIDYSEAPNKFGQQIRETFPLAEVFIDGINRPNCEIMLNRFVNLIFGDNSITLYHDEYGMYLARSASFRSSDLSRQVGAAIFRATGEIASVGCNEVPKYGGGTYWCGDLNDARDFAIGEDPNERMKREILFEIIDVLFKKKKLSRELSEIGTTKEIMNALMNDDTGLRDSKVMDLLEFGRVIHAEMSAISDAARLGIPINGGVLYSTTFPCHICAKHIVAAGIDRVVFLEPYPKSYAKELHWDSIEVEGDAVSDKVRFEPFVGISPFRYRDFFEKGRRKDDNGKVRQWKDGEATPIVEIYKPIYTTLETLVSSDLKSEIRRLREQLKPSPEAS